METTVDLYGAESLEELWAVLLTTHSIRGSASWHEPYGLFRQFHANDPESAEVTAALLCTDYRWRNGTHLLIDHLATSGMLSDQALDELAASFLADHYELTVLEEVIDGAVPDREIDLSRPIWPPLRRWAASRTVEQEPLKWLLLLNWAKELSSRDGAAIAAGVMDAAGHIDAAERTGAIEVGLCWGSGTVRLAALPVFAQLNGFDIARARALDDPSAKVRAWATKSVDPPVGPAVDGAEAESNLVPLPNRNAPASQANTLF